MLRPRGRWFLPALVVLLMTLMTALSGCGGGQDEPAKKVEEPDQATAGCRAKWADLGTSVAANESQTEPSALASRWTSVTATIDYYASSAKESDCGSPLQAQQKAIESLRSFVTKVRPYDMEVRVEKVSEAAQTYATSPRPPAPKVKKAGKKRSRPARPPKPSVVAAALKTAKAQAPVATRQQGPAWQQARVVEIGDSAAVKKTLKDLKFLSAESKAYRRCVGALATINVALAAVKKR